jgi:Glycogen debranching enzyme
MKKKLLYLSLCVVALWSCNNKEKIVSYDVIKNDLRAPAYPLITIDPYTSAWSMTDKLYDESVKHWTGKDFPLIGALKVDNKVYRFMGTENVPMITIVPTSEQGSWTGKYITTKPADGWMNKDFKDDSWKSGPAAFGTVENEVTAKTQWDSEYIWVRRTIDLKEDITAKKVFLEYSHDDDVIIYVNGIEVVNTGNACRKNVLLELTGEARASLKKGENIIAAYCYNRVGNGLLDFGIVAEKEGKALLPNTAVQKSVDVQATQTHYVFTCGEVDLKLTFSAPLFMDDLKLMTRPVNYISYEVASNDGKNHDVEIYFEASTAWALDKPLQKSTSETLEDNGLVFLKTGSVDQPILAKQGDDLRIDWGYFYMAAEKDNSVCEIADSEILRAAFTGEERKTDGDKDPNNRLALTRKLGTVKDATAGKIMLGYDDIYSIQYFGENLRPYWNTTGDQSILAEFHKANKEYDNLISRCYAFDKELMETATKAGGKKYAELCALAYRQSIAAHKLVKAPNGDLLFLSKENNSNGSIGTVDITYPSAPLFLYYNPELAKGLMNHIYYYSESGKWTKPFPAHDVGTYPLANGQTYGGDMPIEESGNMIIITAAVAAMEGNAKYAEKHWDVLTTWTDYLVEYGLDPENQLCTDDFAGHFAHNVNLSVKAIMGVACYGRMADMLGKKEQAEKYTAKAKEMAQAWIKMANDGDHYRLTFDKPGTWSQKYNMVWDKLMKLNIFPEEIVETEIAYYLTKQNKYGLPLDNRETYTKSDWVMWTATMAKDKATFEKFIDPLYLFYNETIDRVPMSDWVFTDSPNWRGFKARSVVGGYYIKMLEEKMK